MKASLLVFLGAALPIAVACGSPPPSNELPRPTRGGPFTCSNGSCVQSFPAYPDDGEWECVDLDGVVVCRGGGAPAGVRPGPPDLAFRCAELPGDVDHRRVCLDPAPDVPPELPASAWRCEIRRDGATEERGCVRDEGGVRLGSPCPGTSGCPAGLRCEEGRCAPARSGPPECWLDADCEGGARCVLAHCEAR